MHVNRAQRREHLDRALFFGPQLLARDNWYPSGLQSVRNSVLCCRDIMAIEENIRDVSTASDGVAESGIAYCKEGIATKEHAKGDEGSEDFDELGDLEVVDMNGAGAILMKALPVETAVHVHCSEEGELGSDPMEEMNPEMLPELTERTSHSHLSASATPDKAMQFDNIIQRILNLHEHLKRPHVKFCSSLFMCLDLLAYFSFCASSCSLSFEVRLHAAMLIML